MSNRCAMVGCAGANWHRGYCGRHVYEAFPESAPGPCSELGCEKRTKSRGLCSMHYARVLRLEQGIADPGQNVVGVDLVEKITSRCEIGDCWIWQRTKNSAGYGTMSLHGKKQYVHRLLWTLLVGEIPDGLEIDHLCKQTACCNPDHLEPVAPRVNKQRSSGITGRHSIQERRRGAALRADEEARR